MALDPRTKMLLDRIAEVDAQVHAIMAEQQRDRAAATERDDAAVVALRASVEQLDHQDSVMVERLNGLDTALNDLLTSLAKQERSVAAARAERDDHQNAVAVAQSAAEGAMLRVSELAERVKVLEVPTAAPNTFLLPVALNRLLAAFALDVPPDEVPASPSAEDADVQITGGVACPPGSHSWVPALARVGADGHTLEVLDVCRTAADGGCTAVRVRPYAAVTLEPAKAKAKAKPRRK